MSSNPGDLPPMVVRWVDYNSLSDSFTFRVFIDSALIELLDVGVIRHGRERLAVVSPLGVVPKPHSPDKLKLIANMSYVNQAIVVPNFQMESVSSLSNLLRAGDFMVSFDLKSGFLAHSSGPRGPAVYSFCLEGKVLLFLQTSFWSGLFALGLHQGPETVGETFGHWIV